MTTLDSESLALLLKHAGIEPDEGDLERFRPLFERYLEALRLLHSVDLKDEEIAPTFQPQWKLKP
ncbi:MAG TPA: hypothetical protein VGB25_05750 [Candidatus Binatia bacterium]